MELHRKWCAINRATPSSYCVVTLDHLERKQRGNKFHCKIVSNVVTVVLWLVSPLGMRFCRLDRVQQKVLKMNQRLTSGGRTFEEKNGAIILFFL